MILGISTSTEEGSVALVLEDAAVSEETFPQGKGHGEQLLAAIDGLLQRSGRRRGEIASVAVDVGPGSFTGIRVGVATALGLSHGLGVPCVGVGSLSAMGVAAIGALGHARVLAVLDAKKGEVYVAVVEADGVRAAPVAFPIARRAEVEHLAATHDATVVGVAAETCLGLNPSRAPAFDLPRASTVARIARVGTAHVLAPSPIYVRAADAVVTMPRVRIP